MTDSCGQPDFLTLADADRLASQLANKVRLQQPCSIAVGVHAGARSAMVMLESPGPVLKPGASLVLPAACLTQIFTATLIMLAAREGRVSLGDEVHAILPAATRYRETAFRQVTVRHLLNHTHGLDDSSLEHVSRRADARIDVDHLCTCLGSEASLYEPGKMYGNGRAGPYLAAAILEELFDQPFEQVLVRRLFDPLGIALRKDPLEDGEICPATGANLRVSTHDLLKFLTWHLPQARSELAAMYQDVVAVPGWYLERGSGLGWRWYGNDWFGHAGATSAGSTVVRFDVKHQIAVALTAKGCNALQVSAQMFGSALPDFASFKFPPRLADDEMASLDLGKYVGCYQNAATSIHVTCESRLRLKALMYSRNAASSSCEPIWKAALYPFKNDLFLTEPRPNGYHLFTHFSRPTTNGYRYLQNGSDLLRRRGIIH